MLQLEHFHIDELLLRQIKRAEQQAARELDDFDEEPTAPRGTQMNRPESIEDEEEGDSVDVEAELDRRQTIAKIKRERESRGSSMAAARRGGASSEPGEDETIDAE
jgi:hypothetical protein